MKPSLFVVPALLAIVMGAGHGTYAQSTSETALKATPPKAIPTFSAVNIGRQAFYYAGGEYVAGKTASRPFLRHG